MNLKSGLRLDYSGMNCGMYEEQARAFLDKLDIDAIPMNQEQQVVLKATEDPYNHSIILRPEGGNVSYEGFNRLDKKKFKISFGDNRDTGDFVFVGKIDGELEGTVFFHTSPIAIR